jgi:hypothetical protein
MLILFGFPVSCIDDISFGGCLFRPFAPNNLPQTNNSALIDFASRYPVGIHTATFVRLFRQCVVCHHLVFANAIHSHTCFKVGLMAEDTDILDYLTDGKGIGKADMKALVGRCSRCDRLVARSAFGGEWRHYCQLEAFW